MLQRKRFIAISFSSKLPMEPFKLGKVAAGLVEYYIDD